MGCSQWTHLENEKGQIKVMCVTWFKEFSWNGKALHPFPPFASLVALIEATQWNKIYEIPNYNDQTPLAASQLLTTISEVGEAWELQQDQVNNTNSAFIFMKNLLIIQGCQSGSFRRCGQLVRFVRLVWWSRWCRWCRWSRLAPNARKKPLERSKICNINDPPPFGILPKTHLIWYRHSVPSF